MSTARIIDYPALVAEILPKVIHTQERYDFYMSKFEDLDIRWDTLSNDYKEMHELLSLLLSDYEKKSVPMHKPTPIQAIEALMEANGLKATDLVGSVFATRSIASEVLNGKREISKKHVVSLSRRFGVSADLFLPI